MKEIEDELNDWRGVLYGFTDEGVAAIEQALRERIARMALSDDMSLPARAGEDYARGWHEALRTFAAAVRGKI